MSGWDVITVFTAGHCAITHVNDETEAEALASVIAEKGYGDVRRRKIVPVSQIGSVYWTETKEKPRE